jgi:DNA-binding NtrC family response regulator
LEAEVVRGNFREDLYFRLNMVELRVPSLRERVEDIPEFIRYFSAKYAARYQRDVWQPGTDELREFCEYHWPGNIRQLSHVIEQSYVLDCVPQVPTRTRALSSDERLPVYDLNQLRSLAVKQALRATEGHKGRAAKLLGVHANTLTRMLAEMKIEQPTALS